jgi:hypothetical protein
MRTLFVGRGDSGVCWYRCALPALALDADWLGVLGEPGALQRVTGGFGVALDEDAWSGYDVVVVQLVHGASLARPHRRAPARRRDRAVRDRRRPARRRGRTGP